MTRRGISVFPKQDTKMWIFSFHLCLVLMLNFHLRLIKSEEQFHGWQCQSGGLGEDAREYSVLSTADATMELLQDTAGPIGSCFWCLCKQIWERAKQSVAAGQRTNLWDAALEAPRPGKEEEEEVLMGQSRDSPEGLYGRADQKVQEDRSSREKLLCNDHNSPLPEPDSTHPITEVTQYLGWYQGRGAGTLRMKEWNWAQEKQQKRCRLHAFYFLLLKVSHQIFRLTVIGLIFPKSGLFCPQQQLVTNLPICTLPNKTYSSCFHKGQEWGDISRRAATWESGC